MKIAIGIPHIGDSGGKDEFQDSLTGLMIRAHKQGIECDRIIRYRDPITYARNKIASIALQNGYDGLLFVDDDMAFDPDLLERLIAHNGDVVGALCFLRRQPHEPSMFRLLDDNKTYVPVFAWKTGSLVDCDAVGMAATYISRHVLEKMAKNSQEYKGMWGFFDNLDFSGEDVRFCFKAKQEGFSVKCDTSLLVDHLVQKRICFGDFAAINENYVQGVRRDLAQKEYVTELAKN